MATRHYYAFTGTERVLDLGEHVDFEGASMAAEAAESTDEGGVVWIFDEDSLKDFISTAAITMGYSVGLQKR